MPASIRQRPLTAQHDSFWWGGAGFLDLAAPYAGFRKVIRGYDRHHGGLQLSPYAASVDRGCGAGGPLICACFDLDGSVVDRLRGLTSSARQLVRRVKRPQKRPYSGPLKIFL